MILKMAIPRIFEYTDPETRKDPQQAKVPSEAGLTKRSEWSEKKTFLKQSGGAVVPLSKEVIVNRLDKYNPGE